MGSDASGVRHKVLIVMNDLSNDGGIALATSENG
jgi:hypothetical protein